MGSCLYTLFHTHEQWSESQVSHVMWGSNPLNSPLLPPIPSVRSPTWALHQMIRHSALKRVALPSRSAESFPDFRLFWVDFVPWWCGVVCARVPACSILYKEWSGGSAGLEWRMLPESAHTPPPRAFQRPIQTPQPGSRRTRAHLYWQTHYHTYILGLLQSKYTQKCQIKCHQMYNIFTLLKQINIKLYKFFF